MKIQNIDIALNRRKFIGTTIATAATAGLSSGCVNQPTEIPNGVPISPFGNKSTAEEVTEGINLEGKTALVTGSNSGIGYETARVFALRGAKVICAARSLEKAEKTSKSILGDTSPLVFDLADWPSIVSATDKIKASENKIDMLICNAGIMELPNLQQVYGIERQFAVNHLGHFILVRRLHEQLISSDQARIVNVSSGAATRLAPPEGIPFDNLSGELEYDPQLFYGISKLANVLFTLELVNQYKNTNVTSNALRPGVIATNLGRHLPRWKVLALETIGSLFTKTIPQGAATTVHVATSPLLDKTTGHFFDDCNPVLAGGQTRNFELAKKLWEVSAEITKNYLS
ncbi:MAG: SDR family oxidoreductase [Pseudomonadota bacterium]|nr:SDR family oxidoreductase [Pseudomonadota bacterium]